MAIDGDDQETADQETDAARPVRLRSALDELPSYRPGRAAASPGSTASGGTGESDDSGPAELIKLSSNENPYPPLPGVVEAATTAAKQMNRYPDMFATGLVQALAERFDVPPAHVATGTGSVGVLQQIIQATVSTGDEVVYAWRSFEAYPIVVGISGATSVRVPLTATAEHDLDAMAAAITDRTRLVLVCSPNNPTGPVIGADALAAFLDRVPSDVLVVIDEAYREFIRDSSAADGLALYRRYPNVAVLRTFSKAYGLAGLRVGFAIAQDDVADALRKTAVPFGVSHVAQHAAVESLRQEEALLARVETVVTERERVAVALAEQGWEIPVAQGNFVWFPTGEATDEFAAHLDQRGLIVRPFSGDGVRVTVGDPASNDRLLAATGEWRDRQRDQHEG